jgi:hypothetical protein
MKKAIALNDGPNDAPIVHQLGPKFVCRRASGTQLALVLERCAKLLMAALAGCVGSRFWDRWFYLRSTRAMFLGFRTWQVTPRTCTNGDPSVASKNSPMRFSQAPRIIAKSSSILCMGCIFMSLSPRKSCFLSNIINGALIIFREWSRTWRSHQMPVPRDQNCTATGLRMPTDVQQGKFTSRLERSFGNVKGEPRGFPHSPGLGVDHAQWIKSVNLHGYAVWHNVFAFVFRAKLSGTVFL